MVESRPLLLLLGTLLDVKAVVMVKGPQIATSPSNIRKNGQVGFMDWIGSVNSRSVWWIEIFVLFNSVDVQKLHHWP